MAELLGTLMLVPVKEFLRRDTVLPVILALLNLQKAAEYPFAFTVMVSVTVTPLILAFPPLTTRFPFIVERDPSFASQLPKRMYVRMYEDKFKTVGDNPTIGIIFVPKRMRQ